VKYYYCRFLVPFSTSARNGKSSAVIVHPTPLLQQQSLHSVGVVDVDSSRDMSSGIFILEAAVNDVEPAHTIVKVSIQQIPKLGTRISAPAHVLGQQENGDLLSHG
jgi:hypothetical protein